MNDAIERVFLIVLDSFGIGEMPDAPFYGDEGSDTLHAVVKSDKFRAETLGKLGLFRTEGVRGWAASEKRRKNLRSAKPCPSHRMRE